MDRDLVRRDQVGKSSTAPRGKNYLLAIAINDYQHCSKLSNAVLDVEAFIEVMTTRYHFETAHITLIKDTQATKRRIEGAFDRLIDLVTPQDNLIVYFSGHGRYHQRRGGFWIPVEAGKGDEHWPDYLSNGLIKDYLSKIKSFHTFLIADSCFSGTLFIDKSKEKFSGDRRDTEPSRWGLTSGKKEIVSDGQPGQHSPFAIALLDVLHKADQPIGVMRICDMVLEKVAANAQQTPMGSPLLVPGHQGGQMVLYFREDEEAIWAAAQAAHTLHAYTAYYEQYPRGKYRKIALEKIDELEEKGDWDKVRKNRLADLLRYLDENPRSPFAPEAQRLADALKAGIPTSRNEPEPATAKPALIVPTPKIEIPVPIIPEHMVLLKGGTFEMGDVMGDKEFGNEKVHTVTVSDFLIAKTELTFEEYDRFCEATRRDKPKDEGWGRGKRPVINVNWFDAVEYCNWCSQQEGLQQVYRINKTEVDADWNANGYRLPTEAEWEYAARAGGKKVRFGNGKDIADPKEINFNGSASSKKSYSVVGAYREKTVPVGSLNSPNALGLHDMSGNVWEWCWDWYTEKYYSNSPAKDPYGPIGGIFRVLRGGSWNYDPILCRTSYRFRIFPGYRVDSIGFRLAKH
ncbi:SUMF1/EgtB/PvdO family nonheme iron enzyme [Haliscomenobacter hydrossis]|uniref:Sulphatase-modifying factor protein n=1 Tax=Haliscomenobacter hydrossis (strain ATCC 27775 / DSM 1100 / LMG 10767 / O) TaxID=760192 RepID=F4KWT7_HALH1|nr:Sulphatase-modifying factor protein [Haliscomenobacter hydrossis DSM 1100]